MLTTYEKENKELKKVITLNKIKSHGEEIDRIIMIPDIRPHYFKASGPFILNQKVKSIEDEMTEYKDYTIYSKYTYKNGKEELDGLNYKHKKKDVEPKNLPPSIEEVLTKYVVSFLNTSGGRLFFGIDDNLFVRGIPNIEDEKHIEHIQIEMTASIAYNVGAQRILKEELDFASIPPDFLLFIWHKVFHSTNKSHIYVLELQIEKGSDEYIYMSRNRTFFHRLAGSTTNYDSATVKKIREQRKSQFKYSYKQNLESITQDSIGNSTEVTPMDEEVAREEVAREEAAAREEAVREEEAAREEEAREEEAREEEAVREE